MSQEKKKYLYMLQVLSKTGVCIDSTTFVSKHNEDTINWRVGELIDKTRYDYNIISLGESKKPRKLVKLEVPNI